MNLLTKVVMNTGTKEAAANNLKKTKKKILFIKERFNKTGYPTMYNRPA